MRDIKQSIQKIVDFGIPIAVLAKKIDKDSSTIGKWLRGESNISHKLEKQLYQLIQQMNVEWQEIVYGEDDNG